jgi:4-amino-4-deoxy-L-arabinose transferase-like glycosyltransferase
MKNARLGITVFAVVLLVVWIIKLDFSDLSYNNNSTAYLGILIMSLLIIFGVRQIKKNKK